MRKILTAATTALTLLWATPALADGPSDAAPTVEVVDAAPVALETPPVTQVPDDPGEALSLVTRIARAAQSGEWFLVVMLVVMLLVFILRLIAGKYSQLSWFRTRWGGWTLAFLGGAAAAIVPALQTGTAVGWAQISAALMLAFTAAGGVEFFKDTKKD